MDGVIYRGTEILPHAVETVNRLMAEGFHVGFLTNNSGKVRGRYIEILSGYGIHVQVSQIMTSGYATAYYLKSLAAEGQSVREGARIYVIGGDGLPVTLESFGFAADTDDEGERCEVVVVGWARNINFNKIARAQNEIINGAMFIATNADAMFPAAAGNLLPGAGAMVASVEAASGVKPKVIGKPNTISLSILMEEMTGAKPSETDSIWVVGDRLDTDIACGNRFGNNTQTVLVTTGISGRLDGENAAGDLKPDHIIDGMDELIGIVTE